MCVGVCGCVCGWEGGRERRRDKGGKEGQAYREKKKGERMRQSQATTTTAAAAAAAAVDGKQPARSPPDRPTAPGHPPLVTDDNRPSVESANQN